MKNKILLLLGFLLTLSFPLSADNGWSVNPYDYRYDMSAYVRLNIDGNEVSDLGNYDVAAFCGNECRGVLDVRTVVGNQYGYIRIHSNSADGDVIGFKIIDKVSGKELKCATTLDFVSDSSVGLPSSPVVVVCANLYDMIFVVDDESIATHQYYGDSLVAPDPVKEGHMFVDWYPELPETVPAEDMTFNAVFNVLSYTITYILDNEVVEKSVVEYGSPVVPPEIPEKYGYTFSGWRDVPETMPARDIEILGSYTVNQYKLTYIVDGQVYKEMTVGYGTVLEPEPLPDREGYTFSGWDGVPETMPASDVTVAGTFSVNSYSAVFRIGDDVIDTRIFKFGQKVDAPEAPLKEGYTFSGWRDVPETMPARDIEILGSYTVNQYKLTYIVDGQVFKEMTVGYGTVLVPEPSPDKEGYTFSGWDGVPETMPASDVTVAGTFSVNSYSAVFRIGDDVIDTRIFEFGQKIDVPEAPLKNGYAFAGWQDVPERMPARDIEIIGWYVSNVEIKFSRKRIHLNCTKYENASIRYTTDGSDPSESYGEVYTAPFLPETDCTVKAVAYKEGFVTTDVSSYIYVAEEHTVPYLHIMPLYRERSLIVVPETDEVRLAASDSILMMGQVLLKGGDEVRQLEFPVEIFDDAAIFEWKSEELLEREPAVLPIVYAQAPSMDYDGACVRMSNDIGRILLYSVSYDDGNVHEYEEPISGDYHSFYPEMTGVIECVAYDDGLFRSDVTQLDIHAVRFDDGWTVILNRSGFLNQAIQEGDALDWESIAVVGPMETEAPMESRDFDLIATLSGLRHIDLSATIPIQGSYANFSDLDRMMSFSMPRSGAYDCDWNLDRIGLLSAIKWNMSEPMAADLFAKIANRHALVYVSELDQAPENAVNKVCGGYAEKLTLTHDYPFCVIDEFTAGEAVFTKNFSRPTSIGQSRGWETVLIPFDVDQIVQMEERQREILPFLAIDSEDEEIAGFWLSSPDREVGDWVDRDSIKGGVPYIIAMPNNPEYIEEFNIRGDIAFIGHGVKVSDIISESGLTDEDGNLRTFYGSFIPMSSSDYVFTLTEEAVDGEEDVVRSVFSHEGDEIRPFECWFDGAPGMKKIGFGGKTDSVSLLLNPKDGLRIWLENGSVMIVSSIDMATAVADMTGSIVRQISLKAGEIECVGALSPGVYVIANRKLLVK